MLLPSHGRRLKPYNPPIRLPSLRLCTHILVSAQTGATDAGPNYGTLAAASRNDGHSSGKEPINPPGLWDGDHLRKSGLPPSDEGNWTLRLSNARPQKDVHACTHNGYLTLSHT